jgi:hypothetical protein
LLAQAEECLLAHRALSRALRIARVVARAYVMELHVEDEVGIARPRPERSRIGRLHGQHVEEAAEDGVHGEEGGGDAAASSEKIPPAQAEPRREPAGLGEDSFLDGTLGGRLGQGRELFVGHEPRGQWDLRAISTAHARAK